MKVFKLFYSLIKAYKTMIITNIILVVAIAVPISIVYTNSLTATFEPVIMNIGIVNHDQGDPVTDHMISYLDNQSNVSSVEDDPEVIADTLYYNDADYILEIPAGFGQSLLNSNVLALEKNVSPGTKTATYVDTMIENYISNFQILNTGTTDINDPDAVQATLDKIEASMASNIEVTTATATNLDADLLGFGASYTHYAAYALMMTLIAIFGLPMVSMRNPEIVKRDTMGHISPTQRNSELFLACTVFGIGFWLLLMVIAAIIYGLDTLTSSHGILLVMSSFVSMLGIEQMAFFLATVAPNKGIISFMSTGVSLFFAFTSGLFVPRDFVSPVMQQIAQIASPIWQVKTDEIILSAEQLSQNQLDTIYQYMGTQVLIALAFVALTYMYRAYQSDNLKTA
ncbi:ABC transporter permease [Aerococcus agrisoli]|uniref:ABC transporter permease n=1 Tax=Aerococcus agrisoli TaxID=2487350 RepID=A0A3N4G6Q1_9LACT|nr:ABC transporter permease [Aerococcus agrisoli]RPA58452.1 ABC transporter permease [Aerococcus agrisoli]